MTQMLAPHVYRVKEQELEQKVLFVGNGLFQTACVLIQTA